MLLHASTSGRRISFHEDASPRNRFASRDACGAGEWNATAHASATPAAAAARGASERTNDDAHNDSWPLRGGRGDGSTPRPRRKDSGAKACRPPPRRSPLHPTSSFGATARELITQSGAAPRRTSSSTGRPRRASSGDCVAKQTSSSARAAQSIGVPVAGSCASASRSPRNPCLCRGGDVMRRTRMSRAVEHALHSPSL